MKRRILLISIGTVLVFGLAVVLGKTYLEYGRRDGPPPPEPGSPPPGNSEFIPADSFNENDLPILVQADFIDLSRVGTISKFRSGAGHDFSSGGETCRSMKHYVAPPLPPSGPPNAAPGAAPKEPTIPIYSPVDGTVTEIQEEQVQIGKQVYIRTESNPAYVFRLFHIYVSDGIVAGTVVKAGQQIGVIGADQGTDIAVQVQTTADARLVSYFAVMPGSIFAKYQARGVKDRSALIITKEYRDAHPFQCSGEQFVHPPGYNSQKEDFVTLN